MFLDQMVEQLLVSRDSPRPALMVLGAVGILLGLLVVCVGSR
jgi:hypothetical protein